MACSKIVLLFIGLYGLAFFIAIIEASPASGNVVTALDELNDASAGQVIEGLDASEIGKGFKALSGDDLQNELGKITPEDIKAALDGLATANIRKLLDTVSTNTLHEFFGDQADGLKSLPSNQLRSTIANLAAAKLAGLAKVAPDDDIGVDAKGLTASKVGSLFHDLPAAAQEKAIDAVPIGDITKAAEKELSGNALGNVLGGGGIGGNIGGGGVGIGGDGVGVGGGVPGVAKDAA